LAAGTANVTISAPGFADFTAPAQLTDGKITILDSQLLPQTDVSSIVVTSTQNFQLDTETAEVTGQLTGQQMTTFGTNGRNFLTFLTQTPGVSNQTGQDEAKVGVVGSAKFSVNGGRTEYNSFDVDGNDVLNVDIAASRGHATLLVYPSLDSIQDMKILTSNYGAQYGRSASGTVLLAVKSGAEKLRGVAYDFVRNEAFNSRNYFDEPGKAPLYRRQDFGFTFGGPLSIPHLRGSGPAKTFFFLSEEWRKEKTPFEFNQAVPSDAERGYNILTRSYGTVADFSDVCSAGGGISSQYPDCPGTSATTGLAPNQENINPIATAYLKTGMIPRANANAGCVSSIGSCYVAAVSPPTDYREDLLRVDRSFNDKWKFFATGVHDHWQTTAAVPQWAGYINSFPSVENSFLGPGISAVAHLTTVLSPTLFNDFSLGATWQRISLEDVPGPGVSLDTSGIDNVANPMGSIFPNGSGKLPSLVFAGTNAEYGGAGFNIDTSYMPWYHTRGAGTISDNVSKSLSKHTLEFGIQLVGAARHEFGGVNGANSGDEQGLLTFSNSGYVEGSNGIPVKEGNAFEAFEFYSNGTNGFLQEGDTESYQQDNTQITYKVSYWTLEPYFQDNFKATPRLTVNLGMRINIFQNWKPDGNTLYNWDPAAFNPNLMTTSNRALDDYGQLNYASYPNPNGGGYALNQVPVPFNGTNPDPVLLNGLVQCGANSVPQSCQTPHRFNASPRVGFAWDPTGTGKTSIRAGYGIFYEHGTGSEANVGSLMGNPPQVLSMSLSNEEFQSIGIADDVSGITSGSRAQGALNMISIPDNTVWPYVQQWSFGIQKEIDKDNQMGIAYVASKGTHLAVAAQLNQLPPVPAGINPYGPNDPITFAVCTGNTSGLTNPSDPNWSNPAVVAGENAACNAFQAHPFSDNYYRPYQGVGKVIALRNVAGSSYSSLQMTAHHAHGPLDLAATLTYSHSIDTASDRFASSFVDADDLPANRASSDFDQRILINVNYIYRLPLLRAVRNFMDFFTRPAEPPVNDDQPKAASAGVEGNTPGDNEDDGDLSPAIKMIFSNWSLSGLTLYQTGTPFSVLNEGSGNGVSVPDNAGLALDDRADSYPDVVPHAAHCYTRYKDTGTVGPIIGNSCQFVAPRGLTQGNAGRNYLNNPSRTNFDIALLKEMKTWEGGNLQFRAEAFNVFNNTQFVVYDPIKGNTSSNMISCYGDVTTGYSAGASTCTTGNGFLHPIEAHRPRTLQFGLKLAF
jgi:hypothetical protein